MSAFFSSDQFPMPYFVDQSDPQFTWVWDNASKNYIKVPAQNADHPDRSHASGGDNDLFDPAVHREKEMNPLAEGILAAIYQNECDRCGGVLNQDGLCSICDRGLFDDSVPLHTRTAPFSDRVPTPDPLKTDPTFPTQATGKTGKTANPHEVGQFIVDMDGNLHYEPSAAGDIDRIMERDNITEPGCAGVVYADGIGKILTTYPGFIPEPGSIEGQLKQAFGEGVTLAPMDNHMKSLPATVISGDMRTISASACPACGSPLDRPDQPCPNCIQKAHENMKNLPNPVDPWGHPQGTSFAHVDEEMAYFASHPDILPDCPSCGDVLISNQREATCHSCGHRQRIAQGPLLPLEMGAAGALADAAGGAGVAAGGASGTGMMGTLMTKALQGGAFRAGEDMLPGGNGKGAPAPTPAAAPVAPETPQMPPGVVTHLIEAGVIESAFGEQEVGQARKNRGDDHNPAAKGTQGFDNEHGDEPGLLKDVNDVGGAREGDESTEGGSNKHGDPEAAMQAFHMNLPLILEFANSDQAGSEHPLLRALDELLEAAFPGYKGDNATHNPLNPEGEPEDHSGGSESPSGVHPGDDKGSDHDKPKKNAAAFPGSSDPMEDAEMSEGNAGGDWEDDQAMMGGGEPERVNQWQMQQLQAAGFSPEQIQQILQIIHAPGLGGSGSHHQFTDLVNQGASPDQAFAIASHYLMSKVGWTQPMQMEPLAPSQLPGAVPGSVPPGAPNVLPGGLQPGGTSACPLCGQNHPPGTPCNPSPDPAGASMAQVPPAQQPVVGATSFAPPFAPPATSGGLAPGGANPGMGAPQAQMCPSCGCAHAPGTPCPTQGNPAGMGQQPLASFWRVAEDFGQQPIAPEQGHEHPSAGAGDTFDQSQGMGAHPGHDWSDDIGQPLQEGREYELVSPNYAVPDKIRVDRILPDKLMFTVRTDLMDYQDEMTKEGQANEGYHFSQANIGPDSMQAGIGHQELPPRPGVDSGAQVDDLSNPPTRVSTMLPMQHELMQPSAQGTTCPACGMHGVDSSGTCQNCGAHINTQPLNVTPENAGAMGMLSSLDPARAWLMDDSDPVAIDPNIYAQVMGRSNGSRQLPEPRYAGKDFSPREQREFIDEPGVARNLASLDLSNTHYPDEEEIDDFFLW